MRREDDEAGRDDRVRFEHMLTAARDARSFVSGRKREDLEVDPMLRRALKDCIQEIGEAARRISDFGQDRAPDLPWTKIVGMRHILVHAYFEIDLDTLWKVAIENVPSLIAALDEVLAKWPDLD
jgi:uncharacterized protein with HEPN domain